MVNSGRPVDALRFAGRQERPLTPNEVVAKSPVLGTGERPSELVELAGKRRIYVRAAGDAPPAPEVHRVEWGEGSETDDGSGLWRVDVAVDPADEGHLPGRTAVRSRPEELLSEIDADVGFDGHRPEWNDQLFLPRGLPAGSTRSIARIGGGRVRPEVIFAPDDRREFLDSSYPWGNVGRIFTSKGTSGTAALIGDRIVVTAGHVVPWNSSSWWMRFVPAYYDGQSLHGAGVQSYVSDVRGYDPGSDTTGYDWAVCRLYEPLGSQLGYFGSNSYSSDWEDEPWWTVVGYPGDVAGAGRPSWQGGISVFDDDSDSNGGQELEHRGDTGPGNSGGPMFAWWGDSPRLIGVHVGAEEDIIVFPPGTELGNVTAGGSGFHNLISWGRTNWP
jgi:V8-like Glu-specific endopeptidase